MKFRLLLSLLAIFLIAKGLGWCEPQLFIASPHIEQQAETPTASISCEAIQPADEPGSYYVHVITTEVSGKHVHRVEDKPFTGGAKGRTKALKECNRLVGQWENLYMPRKKSK